MVQGSGGDGECSRRRPEAWQSPAVDLPRHPRLQLSFDHYTQAMDIWSVACIFAEMLGRKYLFAGKDYVGQLTLILKVLGAPTEAVIARAGSKKVQAYLRSCRRVPAPSPVRNQ